jgi:hypothetical protein
VEGEKVKGALRSLEKARCGASFVTTSLIPASSTKLLPFRNTIPLTPYIYALDSVGIYHLYREYRRCVKLDIVLLPHLYLT